MATALSPEKCARLRRLSETYGLAKAAEIGKVSTSTLWALKKRGWAPVQIGKQRRPLPADFAVMANRMPYDELLAHYRVGAPTLCRWIAQVDRRYVSRKLYPKRALPDRAALADALQQGGIKGACAEFCVSDDTLLRWRHALGLPIGPVGRRRKAQPVEPAFGWADRYFRSQERAGVPSPSRSLPAAGPSSGAAACSPGASQEQHHSPSGRGAFEGAGA
jgi:hypothetical protein